MGISKSLQDNAYRRISPTKIILGGFLVIILIGALLLMLPAASATGKTTDFLSCMFTATSATCVTGLTVFDTLSHWSGFGHIVILLLIQCGGLGFMVFAALFSLVIHRRISLRERLIMTQLFSVDELSGIVRLTKHILSRTLVIEGAGALLLAIRFIPDYGFGSGLFKSVFHSVSAFCNAGFDILGVGAGDIGSISKYATDPLVCLTLVSLMVVGGLGFLVWENVLRAKKIRRFSFHTKLVLIMTASLLLFGTVMFFVFEYSNAATIGRMSFGEKLIASLFQSSTTRTAGFYSFSQGDMTVQSKLLSCFLMLIGGSPGSTAGGIKTVTFAVLILTAVSVMRGKNEISAMGRKISYYTVFKAIAVMMVGMFLAAVGGVIICQTNGTPAVDSLFEAVSAFSTTGLSCGITAELNSLSKIVLILLMYFGRVGLLTLSIGLLAPRKPSKISYPEGKIIIG